MKVKTLISGLLVFFICFIAGGFGAAAPPPGGTTPAPKFIAATPEQKKKTPIGMVYVPAGEFIMGEGYGGSGNEAPVHRVYLDTFYIDKFEVTVKQYAACVQAGKCSEPHKEIVDDYWGPTCNWGLKGKENYPINCVDFNQADTFCKWAGKRLPTEAEWEKAARGTDGRSYPWGEKISCTRANYIDCNIRGTKPVGSYPTGASPYGAMDMAGNVWEFVADWFRYDYYKYSPDRNPTGPPSGEERILRGGSWYYSDFTLQTMYRQDITPDIQDSLTGFRCAMYPDGSQPAQNAFAPGTMPKHVDIKLVLATPEQEKKSPPGMVYVPAGDFMMGCSDEFDEGCAENEKPYHKVTLDAFYIDRNEVTSQQYAACFGGGKCSQPKTSPGCNWKVPDHNNHPINCVDWFQAEAFCKWAGKRLPTEAEWEKAAKGTDGRIWPWGNDGSILDYAAVSEEVEFVDVEPTTYPVGSKPKGASPYGVMDMIGNVWEWTSDWFDESYYKNSPASNPQGPSSGVERVMRGGCFDRYYAPSLRASYRGNVDPYRREMQVGFRCAKTP